MKRHVVLLLLCLLPLVVFADALPSAPYVQVTGNGAITAVPDIAHVSVTVEKTGENLTAVRAEVEQRSRQVIESAQHLGVAERDISANSLSIWPEYRWQNNTQIFVGQHVSRRIEITLRKLGRYADLGSALVSVGVNVSNTVLDCSDMPALRRQALAQAVTDAHARALAAAEAASTNLGLVYSISENTGFVRPQLMMQAARTANAGDAKYEPGTIEITADVTAVYLLKITGNH